MSKVFEWIQPYLDKGIAYQTALVLLEWDQETLAPVEAQDYTAKVVGELSDSYMQVMTNAEVQKHLHTLEKEFATLDPKEQAIVKEWKKILAQLAYIPKEEYKEYTTLVAKAGAIWSRAKEKNDFSAFAPTLEEIIGRRITKRKRKRNCMIFFWRIMNQDLLWKF